jgi:hypothetical protein
MTSHASETTFTESVQALAQDSMGADVIPWGVGIGLLLGLAADVLLAREYIVDERGRPRRRRSWRDLRHCPVRLSPQSPEALENQVTAPVTSLGVTTPEGDRLGMLNDGPCRS